MLQPVEHADQRLAAIRSHGRDRARARAERRFPGRRDERAPWPDEARRLTGFNSFQIASPASSLYEAHRVVPNGGRVVATAFGAGPVRPGQHDTSVADAAIAACRRIPQVALHEDGALAELIQEAGLSVEKVGDVVCEYRWDDLGTALRRRRSVRSLAIAML